MGHFTETAAFESSSQELSFELNNTCIAEIFCGEQVQNKPTRPIFWAGNKEQLLNCQTTWMK